MRAPPDEALDRLSRGGRRAVVDRRVGGGDISHAFKLWVGDAPVFCKALPDAPTGFFAAEAAGLDWLDQGVLHVPHVIDHGPTWIAMTWVSAGSGGASTDEALGWGLAELHASLGIPDYSARIHPDSFIGRLPQDNAPVTAGTWAAFYRERRVFPQIRAARAQLGPDLTRRLDALAASLEDRVAPEAPSRLHGDLWGGNWMVDDLGRPVLIDPACGPGHRELDLAMMQLFGGFSPRVFSAYAEVAPLQPGWRERTPLYQLYYLLVHVNLFGQAWVGRVRTVLDQLGA